MTAALDLVVTAPARADGDVASGWRQRGVASFYADFWQGRRTASGERFDNDALTAAHPWLPFGTRVRVLAEGSGQAVVVTITDRMPPQRRIIDLSQRAARALGMMRQGTAAVTLVTE